MELVIYLDESGTNLGGLLSATDYSKTPPVQWRAV